MRKRISDKNCLLRENKTLKINIKCIFHTEVTRRKKLILERTLIFDQGWQLCSGEAMKVNRKIFYRNLTYFEIDLYKKVSSQIRLSN